MKKKKAKKRILSTQFTQSNPYKFYKFIENKISKRAIKLVNRLKRISECV